MTGVQTCALPIFVSVMQAMYTQVGPTGPSGPAGATGATGPGVEAFEREIKLSIYMEV